MHMPKISVHVKLPARTCKIEPGIALRNWQTGLQLNRNHFLFALRILMWRDVPRRGHV